MTLTPRSTREAVRVTGLEFTPAELRQMAPLVARNLEAYALQRAAELRNDEPPAVTFDPRLPGMRLAPRGGGLRRSAASVPRLPRSDEDIAFAPVTWLARWIERREISAERLTRIYLERLERYDPALHCVATLMRRQALRAARRADAELARGVYRGPLHGIPWGAKDLLDTRGVETAWGAEPYRNRRPKRNAAVVTLLEQAGAILVAKLSLGALAYGDVWYGGRTGNPFSLGTGSSGSSAGSASATAAGLVGFAVGSETLGSIISPATTCGVAGLRPTFGRVSRSGAMALCWSMDKLGPITRTVEDAALVLSAIAGAEPDGSPPDAGRVDLPLDLDCRRGVRGLRVGYEPASVRGPERRAARDALRALRAAGATTVPVRFPDLPIDEMMPILWSEAAAAFDDLTRSNRDDELTRQDDQAWPNRFRSSRLIPAVELIQAERLRRRGMTALDEFLERRGLDALLSPQGADDGMLALTNFTGHPALTLRVAMRDGVEGEDAPAGRGVSVVLWGRLFEEGQLVRLGLAIERRMPAWRVRPLLA